MTTEPDWPNTLRQPPHVTWNGRTWYRNIRSGYYSDSKARSLHRTVHEVAHGPIPAGFDVHHRDGNRANNHPSNLEAESPSSHHRRHTAEWMADPENAARALAAIHNDEAKDRARAWHASEEGRAWHAAHAQKQWSDEGRERQARSAVCVQCGETFTAYQQRRRFCSSRCNQAHVVEAGRHAGDERACDECGATFIPKTKYRPIRFCSKRCAGKSNARARMAPR